MRFSLILSTRGRVKEIERFLQSLSAQTLQDYELIISDQNEDDRLAVMLKTINWPGKLTHLKSSGGVSRGRNAGIALAQGEIIGFPDDDCMYFPTLLEDVARFFDTHPEYGYLSGRSVADHGGDAASTHGKVAGPIHRLTIYVQCIEFAMFLRRESMGETRFDENMGVGSPRWQSDEGPDLMLSMEEKGVRGYYEPEFAIWHPDVELTIDEAVIGRSYKYACGSGYFLRKHDYPFWFLLQLNAKTFLGVVLSLLTLKLNKARYYWARIRGRWEGWKGFAESRQSPI